jgi:predicted ATPase
MTDGLTPQEAAWLDQLKPRVWDFKQNWEQWPAERRQAALREMCQVAELLHASLKTRGLEPRHSKHMIDNRAREKQKPFYFNLHALEDLMSIVTALEVSTGRDTTMIKRIYIDNYKSLVNFELPLKQLTLLLGPNGVGKTSVLDVMFALRRLISGEARVAEADVFPASTLTRWQDREKQVFELDVALNGDELRYRLEVEHDRATRRAQISLERLESMSKPLFAFDMGEVQLYRDDHSQGPRYSADRAESALARVPPRNDNTRLTRFLDFVRKVIVCGLYPAGFETESSTEDAVLDRDACNFASWYRHALLERSELVPKLTTALQEVIEGFRGIRMEKVGLDTRALMVMLDQFGARYELRLAEISDGQRALIALYALVWLVAGQGYTLLLDEPENYIALAEIQPWLVALADACGGEVPQAMLCSHHPELIDYLGADRGVLLTRESSGVTKARPLAETAVDDGLRLSERVARGWQL